MKTVKHVDHRIGGDNLREKREMNVWTTNIFLKQVTVVGLASKRE